MARRRKRWVWAARGILSALPFLATATSARAQDAPAPAPAPATAPLSPTPPHGTPGTRTWSERYEEAHKHLVLGEYDAAYEEFSDLALVAPTDADRRLAVEMARVSAGAAARAGMDWLKAQPPAAPPPERPRRTTDEITLLYTSGFLYGVGTGAWFLLQTQPDSALTATLPFIGIAAAPVIGLAIVDGAHPLPHAVPHGITAGLYLGLGEGIWVVGYQHARADRLDATGNGPPRWNATVTSSVLWGGATLGAITGAAMTTAIPTTPGRVSYSASTTLWGGFLSGFAVSSLVPSSGHRSEDALLGAGLGYNAGLLGGLLSARAVSPSLARVRFVDLGGASGGLLAGGLYLAFAGGEANSRAAMGLSALGAATGLTIGWIATRGMQPEYPSVTPTPPPPISYTPTIIPVEKGAALGIAGTMF